MRVCTEQPRRHLSAAAPTPSQHLEGSSHGRGCVCNRRCPTRNPTRAASTQGTIATVHCRNTYGRAGPGLRGQWPWPWPPPVARFATRPSLLQPATAHNRGARPHAGASLLSHAYAPLAPGAQCSAAHRAPGRDVARVYLARGVCKRGRHRGRRKSAQSARPLLLSWRSQPGGNRNSSV